MSCSNRQQYYGYTENFGYPSRCIERYTPQDAKIMAEATPTFAMLVQKSPTEVLAIKEKNSALHNFLFKKRQRNQENLKKIEELIAQSNLEIKQQMMNLEKQRVQTGGKAIYPKLPSTVDTFDKLLNYGREEVSAVSAELSIVDDFCGNLYGPTGQFLELAFNKDTNPMTSKCRLKGGDMNPAQCPSGYKYPCYPARN